MDKKYKAPALAKGLDIIDLIQHAGPLSFNDIQHRTNDNPGSLNRYLSTLLEKGYLMKTLNNQYDLGIKLIGLSSNDSMFDKIRTQLRPIMEQINNSYDVTTLLLIYKDGQFRAYEKFIARENLGMMHRNSTYPNTIYSLWGNCYYDDNISDHYESIMASQIKLISSSYTKEIIQSLINSVKTYGYMYNKDSKKNITRYGFPIKVSGKVIATLAIGTFFDRLSDEETTEMIEMAKGAIHQLTTSL